jgi:DNA-binding MarR family transcriptional regulator
MEKLIQQLEQYLQETLGVRVTCHSWEKSNNLPFYLQDRYVYFMTELSGIEYVLMIDAGQEEQTPAVISKHIEQVRTQNNVEVIFIRESTTSYNRKRLVEHKVPFIVPGNQMYLPMLGIDFREHLKKLRKTKLKFAPATQVLILYALYQNQIDVLTPFQIAQHLGYKAMTMTRAFDELESAGIGIFTTTGKERRLRFESTGKVLWEKVLPYLNTPVRKHIHISSELKLENKILAGLSALSHYTMLAEPRNPVLAFSADEWKVQIKGKDVFELPAAEPGSVEVELWKYSPSQFADNRKVDRLSLYLSLKDSADERVQSALDELLGGMKW